MTGMGLIAFFQQLVFINELLWFVMMAICFLLVMFSYRVFGKTGLYLWIALSVIVANIQVLKTVQLFTLTTTLGNIVYASTFLATDILSENHGKSAARKGVFTGFFSLIVSTLLMNMALLFRPDASDFAQESLRTLFGIMPRIAGASLLAYGLSQFHDVWAYNFWKKRFPSSRMIWLRNNASTSVSQLIDTCIFTFAAFTGVFPFTVVIQILVTTYVMKLIVAVCDTPFIYWSRRIEKKRES